jgi:hypothetical protein
MVLSILAGCHFQWTFYMIINTNICVSTNKHPRGSSESRQDQAMPQFPSGSWAQSHSHHTVPFSASSSSTSGPQMASAQFLIFPPSARKKPLSLADNEARSYLQWLLHHLSGATHCPFLKGGVPGLSLTGQSLSRQEQHQADPDEAEPEP